MKNNIQDSETSSTVHRNTNVDSEKVMKDAVDTRQFRHFWSFYESFKDDEDEASDDLEDDKNPISLEALVVEEVLKNRISEHS